MVLTVTEPAQEKILELRAQEDEPDTLGLRIEVTGVRGPEYTYPADSTDALKGATLDLPSTAGQAGLVLRNPNRPDPLSGAHLELSGTTAEKVQQLLDQQINPSLAMHGGFATLDRVEGETVYVTMGGGCQGCAVSAMT